LANLIEKLFLGGIAIAAEIVAITIGISISIVAIAFEI